MSVMTRELWVQRYACAGVVYLMIVSALQWSRGGTVRGESVDDLWTSYGAWYAIGFLLLAFGWWRAARRDGRPPTPARP